MDAVGNCRACMVEIKGERVLAPSLLPRPDRRHGGQQRQRARRRVAEDGAGAAAVGHARDGLHAPQRSGRVGRASWASASRASPRAARSPPDLSHPAIAVNLDACIQCTRCLRACRDEQVNDVIGLAFRGEHAKIVFDMDDPMGVSTCVACGECVQACPTGALMPARDAALHRARQAGRLGLPVLRRRLPAHLQRQGQQDPVRRRPRRPGQPRPPVRQGPLRLRLRAPSAAPDDAADPPRRCAQDAATSTMDPDRVMDVFREATLGRSAGTGRRQAAQHPRHSTARRRWPASARPRAATRRPTCSRSWCAPASAATTSTTARACATPRRWSALLEGIGSGAVSNPVMDVTKAEVVVIIGANPTVNHPVAATWIKNAVQQRHQADRDGSAPLGPGAHGAPLPAVQARHRRGDAQRDDARHRARGPGRPGLHRQPHHRLRGAAARTSRATAPRRWRRSAASTPRRMRYVARAVRHLARPR